MKKVLLTIEIIVCVLVLALAVYLYQSKNNLQKDIVNKQNEISEIETNTNNRKEAYNTISQELDAAKNDDANKELVIWQRRMEQLEAAIH